MKKEKKVKPMKKMDMTKLEDERTVITLQLMSMKLKNIHQNILN
jgi:hypothetical protein